MKATTILALVAMVITVGVTVCHFSVTDAHAKATHIKDPNLPLGNGSCQTTISSSGNSNQHFPTVHQK